jgi:hypothetical protein
MRDRIHDPRLVVRLIFHEADTLRERQHKYSAMSAVNFGTVLLTTRIKMTTREYVGDHDSGDGADEDGEACCASQSFFQGVRQIWYLGAELFRALRGNVM